MPAWPHHLSWLLLKGDYRYRFCQIPQTRCLLQRVTSRSFSWKEGFCWSECDSQRAGLQLRWESLGSTHQGACKLQRSKKSLFKDRDGVSSKGLSKWGPPSSASCELCPHRRQCLKGSRPVLSPWKTQTCPPTRRMWGWGWVSSKFTALSSLVPAPHNLGGAYLTNGCDSDNLLKMLMSTRRAPGSIKVLTWPGMCLNQSRAACGIFIRQFSKHAASPWRCNKHLGSWISWILLLNGRIILSVFAPPSCYKFSKSTSFFFFFWRLFL